MTGIMRPGRRPILTLTVRNALGQSQTVEALLDTGFSAELSLPSHVIQSLGLRLVATDRVTLADGRVLDIDLSEGIVVWDGHERLVAIHCLEGTPLIGMSLIYNHLLTVEARDHGTATLMVLP